MFSFAEQQVCQIQFWSDGLATSGDGFFGRVENDTVHWGPGRQLADAGSDLGHHVVGQDLLAGENVFDLRVDVGQKFKGHPVRRAGRLGETRLQGADADKFVGIFLEAW